MSAFHLWLRNYSRGAKYCVCLECDCLGVDIICFLLYFHSWYYVIDWQQK
jgi:hypothetical protein